MNPYIKRIQERIEPLRREIIRHPVYEKIRTIADLRIFMQYHVYAVWDFMSLLKTLQNRLTCTSVPWFPVGSADVRYFINAIVVGEECDTDWVGKCASHFEMYLSAMHQCGAATHEIEIFIDYLRQKNDFQTAFRVAQTPRAAVDFVQNTFEVINSDKTHVQAAVFTFGREDLIPDMFVSVLSELHRNFPESVSQFQYYIERHIEVDGGEHSPLALKMTEELCGEDEIFWREAEEAVVLSLQSRIGLWDGVFQKLSAKN